MNVRLLAAIGWTALICVLCWAPIHAPVPPPDTGGWLHVDPDKLVHAALFGVFAVLWMFALRRADRWIWVLGGGIALAIITELGQTIPALQREGDLIDGLADSFGIALGVGAAVLAARWWANRRPAALAEVEA